MGKVDQGLVIIQRKEKQGHKGPKKEKGKKKVYYTNPKKGHEKQEFEHFKCRT